jgi:HAD superfamily hydrolase (TIGR01490 family)
VKKGIAFFDFDGTITTRDTLLEFIRFSRGNSRFLAGFALHSPYIMAYRLKLIPNQLAKEKILRFFFRGMPLTEFARLCDAFTQRRLPALIRAGALDEINRLKQAGAEVVIVSASPENWILGWAGALGLQLIASRLEVVDGRLTGKMLGKNCHGVEKVRRILEKHTIADYAEVYAYGDSSGDRPMLELATHAVYRPFRK